MTRMLQTWKQTHGNLPIQFHFSSHALQWTLGRTMVATVNYVPPPPLFQSQNYASRHVLIETMVNYLLPRKKLGVLSMLGILYMHQASELWAEDLLSGGLGLVRFLRQESILQGTLPQVPCELMRVSVNQKRVRQLVEDPQNLKRIFKNS
jgi:hypothetical protein